MSGKIVLLAGPCESTSIVYHYLSRRMPIAKVVLEQPVGRAEFLKHRIKRLGLRKVIGQVFFAGVAVPALRAKSSARVAELKSRLGLEAGPIPEDVIARVPSANSDQSIALLRELEPAVVVINGTRILAKRVLTSVSARFLNLHAGITPMYRGVHGGYWALVEGHREACGVTVHLVDPGIDTGGILGQAVIQPAARDSFITYPYLQLGAGLPLLEQAIRDLLAGRIEVRPAPAGESRLWSHPGLLEYLGHRIRAGVK